MKISRFLGLAVTVALAASVYSIYRSGPSSSTPKAPNQQRGGQLVVSIRSELRSYNRLTSRDQNTEVVSLLTQGRLVRINRSTFDLEPWLAERWESSPDGRTYTLHLRPGAAVPGV